MNHITTAFKKYGTFNGRARRAEYWYFALFILIVSIMIGFVEAMFGLASEGEAGIVSLVFSLAVLVPSIAVGVRRMHDVNKRGWFILIPIYSLILALTEGTEGDNKFGPDPKTT